MARIAPAHLVVLGGVAAALHVGKLPPALPVLREALGVSLVQAGFLLSMVQLAGMTLGLAVGLAADTLGLRRTMVAGLVILSVAGFAGPWAGGPLDLLVLRGLEGIGLLLAAMPAPSLIRRLVDPQRLSRTLGLWGAYMPVGTASALLAGPVVIALAGWQWWWWLLATLSLVLAVWLWKAVPASMDRRPGSAAGASAWTTRLATTLRSRGPWTVALGFGLYSGQWLAVIGFLPSVYAQAGVPLGWAAPGTALVAAVNMVGNIGSGRLLQGGVPPARLLAIGYCAMGVCGMLAFAPIWGDAPAGLVAGLRFGAVLAFSMVGGVIPGTLFSLSVRLAPGDATVSTTVGWMQQWSSIGQFAGPPMVAWVATLAGGWQWSWLVTSGMAACGALVVRSVHRQLRRAPGQGLES